MPTLSKTVALLLLVQPATSSLLPTTDLLAQANVAVSSTDAIAYRAMAAGAGLTTLGVAMRPVQMLKLSLTLLTPFVEMAKNNKGWKHQLSRDSSIFSSFKGLGQEKMVLHDTNDVPSWDLPPLATLKESCHLLESNLKQPLRNNWIQPGGLSQSRQDFYLCLASSMQLEMIGRQCEIDREISDYYGEPVCLCTRAA